MHMPAGSLRRFRRLQALADCLIGWVTKGAWEPHSTGAADSEVGGALSGPPSRFVGPNQFSQTPIRMPENGYVSIELDFKQHSTGKTFSGTYIYIYV